MIRAAARDVDDARIRTALDAVTAMIALFATTRPRTERTPAGEGDAHVVDVRDRTRGRMRVVLRDGMTVLRTMAVGERDWNIVLTMDQISGTCGAGEGDPIASARLHLTAAASMLRAPHVDDLPRMMREALDVARLFGTRSAAQSGWIGKSGTLMRPSSPFGPATGVARSDEPHHDPGDAIQAGRDSLDALDRIAGGVFEIGGLLPTITLSPLNVHDRFETEGALDLMRELKRAQDVCGVPLTLMAA